MSVKKKVNIVDDIPSYIGEPGELCLYNNTPFMIQCDGATPGGHTVGAVITGTALQNVYVTNELSWNAAPTASESDTNIYEIITLRSDGILIVGSSNELNANPTVDLSVYDTMSFPLADERKPNSRANPGDILWRHQQLIIYTYDCWWVLALL